MKKKYDIFNINNIILSPEAMMDKLIPAGFQHSSFVYCVYSSMLWLLKNIVVTLFKSPLRYKIAGIKAYSHLYDRKILFHLPSLNNIRSLRNVINSVRKEKDNVVVVNNIGDYETYPVLCMNIISLCYLPVLWKGFVKLNQRDRKLVCFYMQHFVYTPGFVWFYDRMLRQYKPECVVLSNDHTYITKPLELLCEDYNVPCLYVQHASVSYAFPELHFSHSFLDGVDALNKYNSEGKCSKGEIILLGACRYDALSEYRMKRKKFRRGCIGIGINEVDDNRIADEVCERLLQYFPDIRIKIRMHPAMKKSPFVFSNKERIIYTCATDESIIDYLDSIDLQISNDSGVHLDAVLGGVRSIAYNLSHSSFGDNYEYVKNGLLYLADGIEQLFRFVENEDYLPIDTLKVREYDDSYGKNYAGHCSDIIADFIIHNLDINYLKTKYNMVRKSTRQYSYFEIPENETDEHRNTYRV